jgi:hypothetical protein
MSRSSLGKLDGRGGLGVGWSSSNAISVDSEVVLVHRHVEEAVVTPVGTPRVTTDPIFLTGGGILSIADNGDLVVDQREEDVLRVNVGAIVGILELISGVDSARDRSVCEELSLHLVYASNRVVFADVVLWVLNGGAIGQTIIALSRGRSMAVTADIDVGAHASLKVECSVLLAGGVRNTDVVSVLVNLGGVATITGATSLAVYDNLGVEADRGSVFATVQDVESISDGRCRALSPAWTAVLRDMLVLVPGKVVDSVHVSPVDALRESISRVKIPSMRRELLFSAFKDGFFNTAATCWRSFVLRDIIASIGGLREGINGCIVQWIVVLSLGGLVPNFLGPGILRGGPSAIRLDVDIVGASADSEESLLTPVSSPRVSDKPVLLAGLLSVADNWDVMHNLHVTGSVTEDASSVVLKSLGHCDTASNRTSLVDFLEHVRLTSDSTEFIDSVHKVLVGDDAGLTWAAVTALVHSRAHLTVVQTAGSVDWAGLIGDLVVSHPFKCVISFTTIAAQILGLTRDNDLRGDVNIGPSCLTGNLYPIRYSGCSGVSPAWATILRDVLVADVCHEALSIDVGPLPLSR